MESRNETDIKGLLLKVSEVKKVPVEAVKIYDRARNLSFEADPEEFKDDVRKAFKSLLSNDGVYIIKGKDKADLMILKENGKYSMALFMSVHDEELKLNLNKFVSGI